jgi:hypothetical protein
MSQGRILQGPKHSHAENGATMADKSPKKNTAKTTAAKSLKEKRAEKRAKTDKKG